MSMRLNQLAVSHAGTALVDVSDLEFEPGRPVTIVGESGSGKSLLAHAIMGTLPASLTARGSLTVNGQSYDLAERTNRRRLWGREMALLPQEPALALDPTMRAREQVAEGARTFQTDKRAARRTAGTLLASLGLGQASAAFPHTLSGGMAQRVAFAAATIGNAPVLIADEPSKGLDQQARTGLEELLKRHLDGGGILLTITHDLDLARGLGGEVLVMKDAHILEHGPARQVLTEPVHPYTRRLLAAEPANWTNSWIRTGAPTGATGGPLISGERLAKAFGGQNSSRTSPSPSAPGNGSPSAAPAAAGKPPWATYCCACSNRTTDTYATPTRCTGAACKSSTRTRPWHSRHAFCSGTRSGTSSAVTGSSQNASKTLWPRSASPRRCSTARPGRSPAANCSASPSSAPCCSNPP